MTAPLLLTPLLRMSGSAAVLITFIIIVRALAGSKLPRQTFNILWGVVLLRLLVPLFISVPVYGRPAVLNEAAAFPVAETAGFHFGGQVLLVISLWIAGAIACAAYFITAHLRSRKEYGEALPIDRQSFYRRWKSRNPLIRSVSIRQAERIITPLTYGVFRPVILIPKLKGWKNNKELEYILAHEYTHIRRFDTAFKWLLLIAAAVHWFNPLVWVMYVLANRDIEISCDEKVVRSMGEKVKASYALALLSMEEKKSIPMLCSGFSKNIIEERIKSIMKFKKISAAGVMAAALVITSAAGVFAATSTKAESAVTTVRSQSDKYEVISGAAGTGKINLDAVKMKPVEKVVNEDGLEYDVYEVEAGGESAWFMPSNPNTSGYITRVMEIPMDGENGEILKRNITGTDGKYSWTTTSKDGTVINYGLEAKEDAGEITEAHVTLTEVPSK